MRIGSIVVATLLLALGTAAAQAPTSLRLTLEIVEVVGGARQVEEHALQVGASGEWAELHVENPGPQGSPVSSRVKVRMSPRGATTLAFDIGRTAADRSSWNARGEVTLPSPGKRVVVARVPRVGGTAEVTISAAP